MGWLDWPGWNKLAEFEKAVTLEYGQAKVFVAMSFDKSLDSAWENGFERAAKAVWLDDASYRS
jgi:hypothetical protein